MSPTLIHLIISGCCGRMGSLLIEEILKDSAHFQLVGALEQAGHPKLGQLIPGTSQRVASDLKGLLAAAEGLIEFTTPEATLEHARLAAGAGVPMVIGTTGLTLSQLGELKILSRHAAIFWSPNMSIGIVIARKAIRSLADLYRKFGLLEKTSIAISETHHAKKKDKPSGTAKLLAEEVQAAAGRFIPEESIEARREGEVVGIHTVSFLTEAEKISLQHEALDRRLFAQGALYVTRAFAPIWKKPGWYGMDNLIR